MLESAEPCQPTYRAQRPPPRPRDETELQVEFARQDKVRWFSPKVLASTGQRVLLSSSIGDFLDKRELQQTFPGEVPTCDADGDEVWIDYVADTGDGFDATYSVAWLTSQRSLEVDGHLLPRAGLLVLGGDQVYPAAFPQAYDDRFKGPYKASLPYTSTNSPALLALPGNHDWYDGLTNFMRLFCTSEEKWIGGRRLVQSRSYFAVRLPRKWWLWGIDIQFDAYIDDPQIQFFKQVAGEMGTGAPLILCTAKPSWVDVEGDRAAFRNLAYLEDRVINPAGLRLLASISGDEHHYARYAAVSGGQKITAGGGGAFTHPTHHLDDLLRVPVDPRGRDRQEFRLQHRYPDARTSRSFSAGAIRLPFTNPSFMLVPAVLYLLLGWATQFANRTLNEGLAGSLEASTERFGWSDVLWGLWLNPVSVALLVVVLGGLVAFAKPSADWSHGPRKLLAKDLMGLGHFVAHLACGAAVGLLVIEFASLFDGAMFTAALLVALAVVGGLAGALVMGIYLAICCAWLRAHGNEAFSSMGLTTYKNFLRLHIDGDGVLTIYPIGLDRANSKWRLDPENRDDEASWLAPDGTELRPRLIERPIVIDPKVVPRSTVIG